MNDHLQGLLAEHLKVIFTRLKFLQDRLGEAPAGSQTVTIFGLVKELERKLGSLQTQSASLDNRIPSGMEMTSADTTTSASAAVASPSDSAFVVEKLPIIEGVITVLNRELEKMTVDVEALERQRRAERELVDSMDRKVRAMERMMAMKDATINELSIRLTSVEQTSYDGTLLWRVSEVKTKRQEAQSGRVTSVYSPPFFTSRTGGLNIVHGL